MKRKNNSKLNILRVVLFLLYTAILITFTLAFGKWLWGPSGKLMPEEPSYTETKEIESTTEPTQPNTEPLDATEAVDNKAIIEQAHQILETMTQEEKIYQLFIVTQEQLTGYTPVTQSGEATREAIEQNPVGGIIYFSQNILSREQCSSMIDNIQSYTKLGLFISVDEEGADVARVGNNPEMGTTSFAPMGIIGQSPNAEKEAYKVGNTIGSEIAQLGFNLDFAPVADVFSNPTNTVIGNRAFSTDPEEAAILVAACVEGFNDSHMLCTLKHFPGHGDTDTDSHYGTAEVYKTLDELRSCEFLPFQAGIDAGAPFVMVGHITITNVTDTPASLSHEVVTGLLREELGFTGIIITDAMNMQAIASNYSSAEATVKALQAGVDMILMPVDLEAAVAGVKSALEQGELTQEQIDEKVLRILETKIEAGIIPTS